MISDKILPYFLIIFGSLFILAGCIAGKDTFFIVQYGYLVDGIVVDNIESRSKGKVKYAPVVKYICGGVEQVQKSFISNSLPVSLGTKLEVYCLDSIPHKFVENEGFSMYGYSFLILFGLIPVPIGLSLIIYKYNRLKVIKNLKDNGSYIIGEVSFVGINRNYKVNGRSPYGFNVKYFDNISNKEYLFKSDNLWYDITNSVKAGDKVKVYLNSNDFKTYWVDTDFVSSTAKI